MGEIETMIAYKYIDTAYYGQNTGNQTKEITDIMNSLQTFNFCPGNGYLSYWNVKVLS